MFFSYLKIGLRNILKYKVFSAINVFGLAVAMSVCMLIILMLDDQQRYDQFHPRKDRTYRILSEARGLSVPNATTPYPLAGTLKAGYPIVEEATHLVRGVGGDAVYNRNAFEMRGFFADPAFFEVFGYELEKGYRDNALVAPNAMVLTSEMARLLFNTENPVGKTVQFVDRGLHHLKRGQDTPPVPWGTFLVTGVIADKAYKSHLKFDVLVSAASLPLLHKTKKIADLTTNWEDAYQSYTYVVLAPGKAEADLNASLGDLVARKYAGIKLEQLKDFRLFGQPLARITPGILVGLPTTYSLPVQVYYFLAFLALVIMLSACLNYTNLSTARSLTRAKEIGVRKVAGAGRRDLVLQFLSESVLTALMALVLASLLLLLVKPAFEGLWINRYLHLDLRHSLPVYGVFFAFAVLIGLLAGAYPALNLSKYQPIAALKSNAAGRARKFGGRKALSVVQFVISLFFIITSIAIFNQFEHLLRFKYAYDTRHIVNIELQRNDYGLMAAQLGSVRGVGGVSASDFVPATGGSSGVGIRKEASRDEFKHFTKLFTDDRFLDNLGLKLVAGRNLPPAGTASDRFVLVNQAAVKELGYQYPAEVIGQTVEAEGDSNALHIVGVVQDFQFRMLMEEDKISPLLVRNQPDKFAYLNVKISAADPAGTVARLAEKWRTLHATRPFKYEFYEQQLAEANQGFVDVVSIFGYIAFLALTIACLGLLGMATYTTERRTREVGIRKVLGAGDAGIALLLSREFLVVLLIAVGIAAPASYLANNLWLRNFPNRVEFGIGPVLAGTLVLLVLGLLTIASQTIKASRRRPVDTLKMD